MGHDDEAREAITPNSHRDAIEDWELAEVLDQALSQLNSGDDFEHILARFPAQAGLLRPMLRVAQLIRRVPPPAPDVVARQAGLNRLLAEVRARRDARVAALLDTAIARLKAGEALETVLAGTPTWASALRPMLEAAVAVSQTPQPIPDQQKKRAGRKRLLRAVRSLRQAQDVARRQAWHALQQKSGQAPEPGLTFEDALDEALARLRDGVDLETALSPYPAFAARMRPLLQIAGQVQRVPPPIPAEEAYFAGRERVVRLAIQQRQRRRRDRVPAAPQGALRLGDLLSRFLGITPHLRRAAITVVLLVAMILGSFSVTRVAADSLPNSRLYPVKRFTERVQLVFTPSTEARANLHLRFSQERLREAEALARRTGKVHSAVLDDMLEENAQFLGTIRQVSPEKQEELLSNGARVFLQQRQVLTELSHADGLLDPSERSALGDFVGKAGDDQAMAEEVQRDLGLAEFIPSPTPLLLATTTSQPSPTREPTTAAAPARPTPVPATATPMPPTATPSAVPAEVVLEPPEPEQPVMPTATSTATETPEPATGTPTATPASGPVSTPPPAAPTAVPTSAPTSAPTAAAPSPTLEIVLPTLPPPGP